MGYALEVQHPTAVAVTLDGRGGFVINVSVDCLLCYRILLNDENSLIRVFSVIFPSVELCNV